MPCLLTELFLHYEQAAALESLYSGFRRNRFRVGYGGLGEDGAYVSLLPNTRLSLKDASVKSYVFTVVFFPSLTTGSAQH